MRVLIDQNFSITGNFIDKFPILFFIVHLTTVFRLHVLQHIMLKGKILSNIEFGKMSYILRMSQNLRREIAEREGKVSARIMDLQLVN